MDKTRTRDEKFMRYAMAAHGSSAYLVALAQTRSEHDAQDVAQDVFCRLLTDGTAFTSDEHLRAWLLRVAANRCHELYRMPWRRRVESSGDAGSELPARGAGTEDAALAELRADPVWRALQTLPRSSAWWRCSTTWRSTRPTKSPASWAARQRRCARACIGRASR